MGWRRFNRCLTAIVAYAACHASAGYRVDSVATSAIASRSCCTHGAACQSGHDGLLNGGGGGNVSVSPYGDPAIPALRSGTALARVQAKSAGLRLVEPERRLSSAPPSPNKNATAGVAFCLVEAASIASAVLGYRRTAVLKNRERLLILRRKSLPSIREL